jgi:hypothetical protein
LLGSGGDRAGDGGGRAEAKEVARARIRLEDFHPLADVSGTDYEVVWSKAMRMGQNPAAICTPAQALTALACGDRPHRG